MHFWTVVVLCCLGAFPLHLRHIDSLGFFFRLPPCALLPVTALVVSFYAYGSRAASSRLGVWLQFVFGKTTLLITPNHQKGSISCDIPNRFRRLYSGLKAGIKGVENGSVYRKIWTVFGGLV